MLSVLTSTIIRLVTSLKRKDWLLKKKESFLYAVRVHLRTGHVLKINSQVLQRFMFNLKYLSSPLKENVNMTN